jgi:mevalonate pyrophosphate decarboxylase
VRAPNLSHSGRFTSGSECRSVIGPLVLFGGIRYLEVTTGQEEGHKRRKMKQLLSCISRTCVQKTTSGHSRLL